MGEGDILLLHTDGLTEHSHGSDDYFPGRLEETLRDVKYLPAAEIYEAITADMLEFSEPSDDISLVVVKRIETAAQRGLAVCVYGSFGSGGALTGDLRCWAACSNA